MPPPRSVGPTIGLVFCYLSLVAYGTVLLSSACLFVHEQYGIAVPIAVLTPVVVFAVVDAGRNLARAASLTVGFALGLLGAGAFFWVRYAFYPQAG